MLFYLSLLAFISLVLLLTYRFRASISPHIPNRLKTLLHSFNSNNRYTPLSTFSSQISAGLSSSAFDIEANVRDGDERTGLDESGVDDVREIMSRERVGFDQARLIRHNQILARNNIDSSGMPLDSKAVTHL